MTTPIRITCKCQRDIPDVQELSRLTDSGHHVVLQFSRSWRNKFDKMPIISALKRSLPEHSVFDSGGDKQTEWITVMPVISRTAVLNQLDLIRKALDAYTDACAMLIAQREAGILSAEWTENEHGGDVCFRNKITGQTVEAPLYGAPTLKKVDPYFFAVFVKTTKELSVIAELFRHDFHDGRRMLDVLIEEEA